MEQGRSVGYDDENVQSFGSRPSTVDTDSGGPSVVPSLGSETGVDGVTGVWGRAVYVSSLRS